MPDDRMPAARATWAWLTLGVVVASTSAILIRYADGADPFAISFWRCAAGAAILVPFVVRTLPSADRNGVRLAVISGAFLAAHFATWISSVRLTSVAASVLLVSTTPVFTAIAGRMMGERLARRAWVGIVLAVGGAGLVGGTDFEGSSLLGNILALGGAAGAAGYFMFGERSRQHLSITEFAVVAYLTAAVAMLPLVVGAGTPLAGYPLATWWALAGMVLGPQLLGHTVINFALRDIDATTVAVVVMAEPLIAGALAFVLFSETPNAWLLAGGFAILAGIYVVTSGPRAPRVADNTGLPG